MSENCGCASGNFGVPSCTKHMGVPTYLYVQGKKDADGVQNFIDLNAEFGQTAFNNLLVADTDTRLFPVGRIEAVEIPRGESIFDEAPSGKKNRLRSGKRSFTCQLRDEGAMPKLIKYFEGLRCKQVQIYIADEDNNLIGSWKGGSGNQKFTGIPIDSGSIDAIFNFKEDAKTDMNLVTFDFDRIFKDEHLYMINGDDGYNNASVADPVDFNDPIRLVTVEIELLSVTGDDAVARINDAFRQGLRNTRTSLGNVTGLIGADFTMKNTTTGSTVTLSPAPIETETGVYAITFGTTQLAGSLMQLSLNVSATQVYDGVSEKVPVD